MGNVGTPDRVIRLIVGVLLIAAPSIVPLPVWAAGWPIWVSIILGLVLAGTAVIGFCPIYAALRLNTKR
jgi:hypothetical protein